MSDSIIPPDEAELLLHRFVTERVPIVAIFLSADGNIRGKITGFVSSSTRQAGLHIISNFSPDKPDEPIASYLTFAVIAGALCQYGDDSQVPPEYPLGSGLRLTLKSGDSITIVEVREKKD